ncbi:MAG TPA: TonB-dependent receptor [Prolixibacteraceae bacterium]|nr:TonB-dependent receptor [Prolixibacteraceae bacterium]
MKKTLFIVFLFFTIVSTAQKFTVSGYVSDITSGERLPQANVYQTEKLSGTTANNFGYYSLTLPEGENTIRISFLGYNSEQLKVNLKRDTVINFLLKPKSDEINEVVVIGNNSKLDDTQMSSTNMSVKQIKAIPSILGESDVLKVMQLLPGVKGGVEGTSGIYVRGGSPDQNLFLLDGIPIYNASHLLGFFSVFNPDAIKAVKIYKGGFPAHYGGRLSSVVDITMKDGNMKQLAGNISIGIISSKLSLEGPLIKDKTSFLLSARRTYIDLLAKPVLAITNKQNNDNITAGAFFHDYNLKVNHVFSGKSRLYLSAYHGKDRGYIGYDDHIKYDWGKEKRDYRQINLTSLNWGNTVASLRWNYLINAKLFSNIIVNYSNYFFDISLKDSEEDYATNLKVSNLFKYYSGIRDFSGKMEFDYFPLPGHDVKFGIQGTRHRFTPGVTQIKNVSDSEQISEKLDTLYGASVIDANDFSVYIEDDFRLGSTVKCNVGLNISLFNVQAQNYIRPQPRVAIRYLPIEKLAIKASYSRMAQHVHLLSTSGINMPTDLWLPVTKAFEPPMSDQIGLAVNYKMPYHIDFSIEGYYKEMSNLIEYKEGASFFGSSTNWEDKVEKGDGTAYGVELLIEKQVGKTTGWIGYTLSWSERLFENLNFGNPFPAKYDNRHDINIAVTHRFSDRIDVGVSWVYNTGNAVTLGTSEYRTASLGDYSRVGGGSIVEYGGRNNFRMPAYHRLDIGVNLHKQKKHGKRTWSFSAYNAYNHINPFFVQWDFVRENAVDTEIGYQSDNGKMVLKKYSLLPIIPSVSYSYSF